MFRFYSNQAIMLTNEELKENVQYVLEMTEHYQKDEEIHKMLRLKGLEEGEVQQILRAVAYSFNQKRMQQNKMAFRINSILFFFFHIIPGMTLLLGFFNIKPAILQIYLLIFAFSLSWVVVVVVPMWMIFNVFAYFHYKRKMLVDGNILEIGI